MNARPRFVFPRHIPELDGVRGIAILLVMALHFLYGDPNPDGILAKLVHRAAGYGIVGVDLFFVLSGFLITGILHDSKGRSGYFRTFFVRRSLRIFPLYYTVLFLILATTTTLGVLGYQSAELRELSRVQWVFWPYLTNFYLAALDSFAIPFFSHFWTLAIEEHFYLFWPFCVAFLSRRRAMELALSLSLVAFSLRVGIDFSRGQNLASQVLTPCRLDALGLGAFTALYVRGVPREEVATALRLTNLGRLALVLLVAVVGLSGLHLVKPNFDFIVMNVRGTVLAALFSTVLVLAASPEGPKVLKQTLAARFFVVHGKYSYGLYVFHSGIAVALDSLGLRESLVARGVPSFLGLLATAGLGLLGSWLLALVSFRFLEEPLLKLKDRYSSTPPTERSAGVIPAS